jgi:hypothetical protein
VGLCVELLWLEKLSKKIALRAALGRAFVFRSCVNICMNMLWDRHPELPYRAVVPWPRVYTVARQQDWVAAVDCVQTWLETSIGRHWCEWCWAGWSLAHSDLCAVSFRWEPAVSLFLLRFGVLED